jgi:zinc protease
MGNGLTVIMDEDHSVDLIGIDVWVKAGSGCENEKMNGVSHLIEHLVFGPTSKRQEGEMDLEMESVGATLDAHTSRDWAHFNTTIAPRYLAKALDILADAVSNAQFKEEYLERERMVILEEIARKQSSPFSLCRDYLAKEIYDAHPYALPIEGTPESIKSITREDIIKHHRAHYVPANIAVVLVGDFDPQQAISEVGKAFQGLPNASPPVVSRPAPTPPEKQVTKAIRGPFKYTYLALGFLGPKAADYTDVCATDVLLTYMGFGYRSWMSAELKANMGAAVDVSTDFLTEKEPGLISLMAAVEEGGVEKAKAAILGKIAEVRNQGISDADIAVAKRSLLGQFAFQNETFEGRANAYGFYFTVSDPEFAVNYISCVQGITNTEITSAARKYLDPDHAVILTLGPGVGGEK